MKRRAYVKQGAHLIPSWMDAQTFGRVKWMREHPKRYSLMLWTGLKAAKLRYWTHLVEWSDDHHPMYKGKECAGAYVTLDAVVEMPGHKLLGILFLTNTNRTEAALKAKQAKSTLFLRRNIPLLTLPIHHTSLEYRVIVLNAIRKLTRPS